MSIIQKLQQSTDNAHCTVSDFTENMAISGKIGHCAML